MGAEAQDPQFAVQSGPASAGLNEPLQEEMEVGANGANPTSQGWSGFT